MDYESLFGGQSEGPQKAKHHQRRKGGFKVAMGEKPGTWKVKARLIVQGRTKRGRSRTPPSLVACLERKRAEGKKKRRSQGSQLERTDFPG